MDNFQSVLGDAAGNALCNVLTVAGAAAPFLAVASLKGGGVATGTAATVAGLAGLAANFGCNYDPDGTPPDGNVGWTGCRTVTNNNGYLYRTWSESTTGDPVLQETGIYELISVTATAVDDRLSRYEWSYTTEPGGPVQVGSRSLPRTQTWELIPNPDSTDVCESPAPGPIGPDIPPYIHTDPASGCRLEVNFNGWAIGGGDITGGVFQIQPAAGALNARNAIGGCNFLPTIHYTTGGSGGGDGGPVSFPVPDPVPPDGDEPWWAAPLRGALAGAAQAAAAEAVEELLEPEYKENNYSLRGVCELDPDGNPIDVTRSTNWPAGNFPVAVISRLDALADMFQFDKDLRQPTCKEEVVPVTGDPVTINFESAQRSVNGADYLRKRFVYFDQVNSTLEDTVNHWRDFTWVAGPVIVNCLGTKLGKPQVWAASLDEAKRVFAHAATIAGVDLTDAKYPASTPKDPRYGQPGLMHVSRDQFGTFGITKRSGPSGSPIGLA